MPRAVVRFSKMLLMVHCDFEKGSRNQHFQSTLLVERERVTKEYSVYALDNAVNSGRPPKYNRCE